MKKSRKVIGLLGAGVLLVLAVLLLYTVGRRLETSGQSQQRGELPQTEQEQTCVVDGITYRKRSDIMSILVMGVDCDSTQQSDSPYEGGQADFQRLIVLDTAHGTVQQLKIDRDTITDVPLMQADGSANASAQLQLCTAHWYGGNPKQSCENTVNAVSDMLGGLPIDGYYALSMNAMSKLNEAVDGVKMTFTEDLTELDPQMKSGATLTLTDEQAEKLMHARYGMSDDRNVKRMGRQRLFLDAFLKQVREKQAKDSNFIIKLYDSLHPYSTEDINMNALTKLINQMGDFAAKGTYTIDGETKLGQKLGDSQEHWEFYMDEDSLDTTMNTLYPLTYIGTAEEEPEE